MMMTRLIIARHGNTFRAGEVVRRVGLTDLPLVESGLEQGRMIGRYLKSENLIPDVLFVSELQRTQQTATEAMKILDVSLPMHALESFNEIDYGVDENQPEEAVVQRLGKDALKAWDGQAIVPQGWKVNPAQVISNWKKFADDVSAKFEGKNILVVTSNGIARFAPHILGDFEGFRARYPLKIATGALCIFDKVGHDEPWQCRAWNLRPKEKLDVI